MKVLLVTGGAGFIGSNFITHFINTHKSYMVVNMDKLTYAGNLENLKDVDSDPKYRFIRGDICDPELVKYMFREYNPSYIINFAAESHVDRSINSASVFGKTNVIGTLNLLECARRFWKNSKQENRFLQVSTDEVYGSIENDNDLFVEESPLMPNSPYSASKAGADMMVRAFHRTYGLPALITRCCNNYAPLQHSEKFIPSCIIKAIRNEPITIYGDGTNVREWIHVLDHCDAITRVLFSGIPGEIYNIGSGEEVTNINMAQLILKSLGKPVDAIVRVRDRLGHDRRYALDSSKIKNAFSWECKYRLLEGLEKTIDWYLKNQPWWDK